jgi:hypothetical protein
MENMPFWIGHVLFWICLGTYETFRNPIVKKTACFGVVFFIGFMTATFFY